MMRLARATHIATIMAVDPHEYYFGMASPIQPEVDPSPSLPYGKIYECVQSCMRGYVLSSPSSAIYVLQPNISP